jgi:hypothetical protein
LTGNFSAFSMLRGVKSNNYKHNGYVEVEAKSDNISTDSINDKEWIREF